jgi:hypothetical protein
MKFKFEISDFIFHKIIEKLGYVTQFGHYASWTLIDF